MNAEQLLHHFDQIADAPDAVARLRQFVLDLAVRGKLVEQDPRDESAEELIRRIEAEKARLFKTGKLRKQIPLPSVSEAEYPFDLPLSWKWAPIRKITTDRGQKVPDKEFSYIDVSSVDKERGRLGEPQILTPDIAPSRARKIVEQGDVIYSCVRPYLLNVAVIEDDFEPKAIVSTAFAVLNGFGLVSPRYLWIVLRSPFFIFCVGEKMRGQAYPAINDQDFARLPIPLPPLAEQHRIVAKVDELMILCDKLETAQTQRETRRDQLVSATLHSLTNGDAGADDGGGVPNGFAKRAHFYFNHLPRLTTRPEHIKQLRQTILNLAIAGRLIEHIAGSNFPGRDWRQTTLDEVCLQITDGEHATPPRTSEGVPLATAKNVRDGYLDLTLTDWVTLATAQKSWNRCKPRHDDILMVCVGATTGRLCRVQNPPDMVLVRSVALLRARTEAVAPSFLELFLRSPAGQSQVWGNVKQTAQPCLYLGRLSKFTMPLPPLAEQQRIVDKVDKLMALCDALEAQLTNNADTRRQLLEATLYTALAGQHEAEISL